MTFSGPLEDRMALRDLLDRYADAVCRVDSVAWAATWADDSLWDLGALGQIYGKARIVETWEAAMLTFPGIVFQAWPGAMAIEGDAATMRSYTAETYDRDGYGHRDLGEYTDRCARIGGRWHFVERRFRPLHRQQTGS